MPLSLQPLTGPVAPTDPIPIVLVDPDGAADSSVDAAFLYDDGTVESLFQGAPSMDVAGFTVSFDDGAVTVARDGGWPDSFTCVFAGSSVSPVQLAGMRVEVTGHTGVSNEPLTILNATEPQSPADFLEVDIGNVAGRGILLTAAFPPEPEREVVYDEDGFTKAYAGSEGPTTNEDGAVHFKLKRALGWPDTAQAKQLRAEAVVG